MPRADAGVFPDAERSHSGLVHRSRKPEWVNAHRGFESHPLRHKSLPIADCRLPIADFSSRPAALQNWQSAIGNRHCWRGAGVVELAALEML
jgi:hypothetical protein